MQGGEGCAGTWPRGLQCRVPGAARVPWVRPLAPTGISSWMPGMAPQAMHVSKALACFGSQIPTELACIKPTHRASL